MTHPTSGPGQGPPSEPVQPAGNSKPLSPSDSKDAFLLQSPFAKMFTATGATPSIKQIKMIIDGILKQQIDVIKQDDAQLKKAMQHLKKVIEGRDD